MIDKIEPKPQLVDEILHPDEYLETPSELARRLDPPSQEDERPYLTDHDDKTFPDEFKKPPREHLDMMEETLEMTRRILAEELDENIKGYTVIPRNRLGDLDTFEPMLIEEESILKDPDYLDYHEALRLLNKNILRKGLDTSVPGFVMLLVTPLAVNEIIFNVGEIFSTWAFNSSPTIMIPGAILAGIYTLRNIAALRNEKYYDPALANVDRPKTIERPHIAKRGDELRATLRQKHFRGFELARRLQVIQPQIEAHREHIEEREHKEARRNARLNEVDKILASEKARLKPPLKTRLLDKMRDPAD